MNFPLNSSATKVYKEELYVETSILENEPTFNFDIFAADSRNKKGSIISVVGKPTVEIMEPF